MHSLSDFQKRNLSRISNQVPSEIFKEFLPLAFHYLKCSLPFEDITQIFADTTKISLTTHEESSIERCLEHYSFSNPSTTLNYIILILMRKKKRKIRIVYPKNWYYFKAFNGVISYGLGRAGWNPVGKSYLLLI